MMPTQKQVEWLATQVRYDPINGGLFWLKAGKGRLLGLRAGTKDARGYWYIRTKGFTVKQHRLIWFMQYGYLPKEIDHINGICGDNRLENLREATRSENCFNRSTFSNNTSGEKGVCRSPIISRPWMARIRVNKKSIYLGCFVTKEEAIVARKAAELKYFGHLT